MAEREHLIALKKGTPGYADDYAAWLAHQVALLQAKRYRELDLPNLIDEVESLGRSDFKAFVSAIEVVLVHMLKWDHQPDRRTRSWQSSIVEHRRRIAKELRDSPSYKARIDEAVADAYDTAAARASAETELPIGTFPEACPYDWKAITMREHALA